MDETRDELLQRIAEQTKKQVFMPGSVLYAEEYWQWLS